MAVVHPAQERGALGRVVGIARRLPGLELVRDSRGAGAHRLPVGDRRVDVLEDADEVCAELLEPLRIRRPVELDADEGLVHSLSVHVRDVGQSAVGVAADAHDRAHDERDVLAAPGELHRHGVHEEGHVVGDDLDDGPGGAGAGLGTDGDLPGGARSRQLEMRERRVDELLWLSAGEVVRRDVRPVAADEARRGVRPDAVRTVRGQSGRRLEDRGLRVCARDRQRNLPVTREYDSGT